MPHRHGVDNLVLIGKQDARTDALWRSNPPPPNNAGADECECEEDAHDYHDDIDVRQTRYFVWGNRRRRGV